MTDSKSAVRSLLLAADMSAADTTHSFNRLSGLRSLFRRLFPEKVKLDFTVVIATYNGSSRLGKVLDCLRCQIGTSMIDWEVIVVDNNSTDDTAKIVAQYQATWPDDIPLRYEFEPQQGAGYARQLRHKRGEQSSNWLFG